MRINLCGIVFALILFDNGPVKPQNVYIVSGRIMDSKTGEPLAAANVRVSGSARGTITNLDGTYSISLPEGRYTFICSYVGYQTDSASVNLTRNIHEDVRLNPADIILPKVVSIAEDPAYAIIRKAIEKKHEWAKLLQSYSFKAFTRFKLNRDTSIAAITESYTDGYWQQGDSLREIVTQKRETKNLPEMQMIASVGEIVNFTDDVIDLLGFKFVGPIANDALDNYKYKLLRTFTKDGAKVYEIMVIPDSRIVPLFTGKISIADSSFAVTGIELQPNEAFVFPFVSDLKLSFSQRYSLYNEKFWMPTDIAMNGGGKISFPGMSFPRIVFDQTSVIYDYELNNVIPDSIFKKPTLVVDSSATKYDSTFWSAHEVVPMTMAEQKAYKTLDSTETLSKQFKPSGAAASAINFSSLRYIDIRYDRVEGLFLGGNYTYISGKSWQMVGFGSEGLINSSGSTGWRLSVAAGYGISDRIFKWRLSAAYPLLQENALEIGLDAHRDIAHFADGDFYPALVTSIFSLFGRNDYQDYYMTYGWKAFINAKPFHGASASLSFTSESEKTAFNHAKFNILSFGHTYRENPEIDDGQMRSLTLDLRYGDNKLPLVGIFPIDAVEISAEYSNPVLIKSDFDFGRYYAVASYFFPTFLRSYLFPPQMQVMFAGGFSTGTLPVQREFVLDSQLGRFAPFGVLKTAYPREFVGDRFVMLSLEHNFRNVPFLILNIPFLYKSGLDVLLDGAAGQSWLNGKSTTNGWYYEAGIGLGKIFELIRMDLTYRISKPNALFFSVGMSSLL